MRVALALVLLIGCTGSTTREPAAPEAMHWAPHEFGNGRVQYRVPTNWSCHEEGGTALCVGTEASDVAKISAGVPEGTADELYEKLKANSPPSHHIARTKISGHEAIETRNGDGTIVVLLLSDDDKYFFMMEWLLKAPFAPQCREVLRSVSFTK